MQKRSCIILFLITLTFFGCDKFSSHYYKLTNECHSPLKVVFIDEGHIHETVVIIPAHEEVMIYEDVLGNTRVEKYKETGENISCFKKIEVFKNDTLMSKTDYSRTYIWTYKQKNKHLAEYLATVNDSDF